MKQGNPSNDHRFYELKEILLKYMSGKISSPMNSQSLEQYISVLSLFIYKTDLDYQYNVPFFIEEHKRFSKFLIHARQQYRELNNIAKDLEAELQKLPSHISSRAKNQKIYLCLNNFLQIDLNMISEIKFCEQFSLSGGNRDKKSYRYTFCVGEKKECFEFTDKQKMLDKIKEVIQEML